MVFLGGPAVGLFYLSIGGISADIQNFVVALLRHIFSFSGKNPLRIDGCILVSDLADNDDPGRQKSGTG
jgi:hypothetical protein